MDLTTHERQAVSKILQDLVYADGELSKAEDEYFSQLKENLDISEAEIEEAKSMKVVDCLLTIRDLPEEKKKKVTVIMLKMIGADGKVNDKEMEILNMVSLSANMPPLG